MDQETTKDSIKSHCELCSQRHKFFFSNLSSSYLQVLSRKMDQIHYSTGENIFKEGMRPMGYLCLKRGKVKITRLSANGKTHIVDLKKAPDTLGIRALASRSKYRSSAIALSPVTICLIPEIDFLEVFDKSPTVSRAVMDYLASRLIQADQKQISISEKHLESRMAETLLELEKKMNRDPNHFIDIDLKRLELAQISNMTTSNAIRTLSEFKHQGFIELCDRRIKILQPQALTKISENGYYHRARD